jgi:cytochrome P450
MSASKSFHPLSARFLADPYAAFAALRKGPGTKGPPAADAGEAPGLIRLDQPYTSWWVVSHALVVDVCETRKNVFIKPGGARNAPPRPFGITSQLADGLFFLNGERHTQVRALMEGAMAGAVERAPNQARALAELLLARARDKKTGRFDLIADFAAPLAMHVFLSLLGIDAPDLKGKSDAELEEDPVMVERTVLDRWLRAMLDGHDKAADKGTLFVGGTAGMAVRSYLEQRIEELRGLGETQSILGFIGKLKKDGGAASADALGTHEAINTAAHFALGGYLSTEFLIGTGVTNLLRHPEQWQMLCDPPKDEKLLQNAIDEMLRYDAPFQMADRWVDAPIDLGGLRIPGDSLVTVVYGAANRDPAVFEDPDRFDITRANAKDHFGFGHGVHRCIGEALARQVTAIALKTLIATVPWVRLGEVGAWRTDPYFRSLRRVELLLR